MSGHGQHNLALHHKLHHLGITSAPAEMRRLVLAIRPWMAAICSAVRPSLSAWLTAAPFLTNSSRQASLCKRTVKVLTVNFFFVFSVQVHHTKRTVCFSVSDPDPQWMQIRIQEGKTYPQKYKKVKFQIFKCWTFSFEDWRPLLKHGRSLQRHRDKVNQHC